MNSVIEKQAGRSLMFVCKIKDIKDFMNKLLLNTDFDMFAVSEVTIMTYNSFVIDGHLQKGYYNEEEWQNLDGERFSLWEMLRPFCLHIIKGKKTPESFKIVLLLSEKDKNKLIDGYEELVAAGYRNDNVHGLYINIKFENGELQITTGTSVAFFTVDKSLENIWVKYVKDFFVVKSIDFEEM